MRGFRIEPGEIEARAAAHRRSRDARGGRARGRPGETRLVAYVVGAVEADAGCASTCGGACRSTWCRPRSWCWSALPLTPNGKVDRRALPAPELRAGGGDVRGAAHARPRRCWRGSGRRCCALERVGVEDELLRAGRPLAAGHARGLARPRGVRGRAAAARALRGAHGGGAGRARGGDAPRGGCRVLPPVVPTGRRGRRCRSRSRRSGSGSSTGWSRGAPPTTSPWRCACAGALDAAALERSLGEIVRRHEALRTTFARGGRRAGAGDRALRRVRRCRWRTCRGSARRIARRRSGARAGEEAQRPFDLARGPALPRGAAAAGRATITCCCSSMHHVVSDGWSMGVLFRELSALYAAYRDGRGVAAAGAAGAVRRLRGVAARAAGGRGAGAAARVLAGAPGGRAGAAGAADGPSPPGGADVPGRDGSGRALRPSCWSGCRRWRGARGRRCT